MTGRRASKGKRGEHPSGLRPAAAPAPFEPRLPISGNGGLKSPPPYWVPETRRRGTTAYHDDGGPRALGAAGEVVRLSGFSGDEAAEEVAAIAAALNAMPRYARPAEGR